MSDQQSLFKEMETYEKNRDQLISDSLGKYVLIQGEEVVDTWDTYTDALQAGYEKFGLKPFLVKKVEAVDAVQFFTRDIAACQ